MLHRRTAAGAAIVAFTASVIVAGNAQMFKYSQTEATTARFDAQRSGWVRTDHFISPDAMKGFALQWKRKIAAKGPLSGAVVAGGGLGITLAFLGTGDNHTVALDMDNGHVFYNHAYAPAAVAPGCLSASLATPTKPTNLTPAPSPQPTPAGQAKVGPNAQLPYGSVIGNPGEGIPPVKPGAYFATKGSFFGAPDAKPYDGTKASAQEGAEHVANYAGPATRARGPVNADGGAPAASAGLTTAQAPGRGNAPGAPQGTMSPGGTGAAPVGPPFGPSSGTGAQPGAAPPRAFFGIRTGGPTYTLSADGVLHVLTSSEGLEGQQPVPFLPPGSQATDLILVNGTLYTSTANSCGGAANGVWAISTTAVPAGGTFPKPVSWTTGGTASPHAIALNADGIVFVTVGSGTGRVSDAVVSLDPKTLEQKAIFTQKGADFVSSPVIFRQDNRDIIAAQAADGRVFLFDGAALSKPLFIGSPGPKLDNYKPQGMASWEDKTGQRWLLTTTATAIEAWKVSFTGTSASVTEGWKLTGLKAPLAPLVINGVVFALSSGDTLGKNPAQLYAIEGITGKTLWTSGNTITTFVPQSSAIWNSMGQVLVGASDETIYSFGMAMDRHL